MVFLATKTLLGLEFEECLFDSRPDFLGGLEADIYVPKYDLVIEYHGLQHYVPGRFSTKRFVATPNSPASLAAVQERDKRKEQRCKDTGKHLIVIDGRKIKIPGMRKRLEPFLRDAFGALSIRTTQTPLDIDSIFQQANSRNVLLSYIPEISHLNDGTMAMEEAFEKMKMQHPAEASFKIPYSKFRNMVFRNFGIHWLTPKDVIARYRNEIVAESTRGRYPCEDFLEILKKKHAEDIPLQKVTLAAFDEWPPRNGVKWARLRSEGMLWMLEHSELLIKWRQEEGLSLTSIANRMRSRGIPTEPMTVRDFFRRMGKGARSVSESQRMSKRFKAAQKAKPNACGNFGRGYRPWSDEDLGLLKQLEGEGKSVEYMSRRLNRSIRAICHKMTEIHPTIDVARGCRTG